MACPATISICSIRTIRTIFGFTLRAAWSRFRKRKYNGGNRASEIIARLRTLFSKKEAAAESVELNEAAREVLALSSDELQRNHVILRREFANDIPRTTGDRVQLQQVILNLLRNASDAMSGVEDRPRVLVIRTEKDEGDGVRLTVRDSGVGKPPQDMERLFDDFYTTKSDGIGMGLSVSRSIIESHGGRLWATPNDGPRAKFSFSIPSKFDSLAKIQTAGQIGYHQAQAREGRENLRSDRVFKNGKSIRNDARERRQ